MPFGVEPGVRAGLPSSGTVTTLEAELATLLSVVDQGEDGSLGEGA